MGGTARQAGKAGAGIVRRRERGRPQGRAYEDGQAQGRPRGGGLAQTHTHTRGVSGSMETWRTLGIRAAYFQAFLSCAMIRGWNRPFLRPFNNHVRILRKPEEPVTFSLKLKRPYNGLIFPVNVRNTIIFAELNIKRFFRIHAQPRQTAQSGIFTKPIR